MQNSDRANDNTIPRPRVAPRPRATPPRILVVEDEPDACEALRQLLVSEGYDVTAETSAPRALARIAKRDFELVLSDVVMAGMTGLDLCRHVLEARPETPVILMTGRGNTNMVIAALRIGVCDFLTKPLDAKSVLESVTRALPDTIRFDLQSEGAANDERDPGVLSLLEVDRRHTLRTIRLLGGNKSRAAKVLGIARRTLYRRLHRYGVKGWT